MTSPTKKVIIFEASLGAGHTYAAYELASRLSQAGMDTTCHDILYCLPLILRMILGCLYMPVVNYFPALLDFMFAFLDSNSSLVRFLVYSVSTQKLRALSQGADIIITTHALATHSLGELKANGTLQIPVCSYICDAGLHDLLFHEAIIVNFVPTIETQKACRSMGQYAESIGPLVRPEFSMFVSENIKAQLRQSLEIPARTTTIVLSAGSLGLGKVLQTVKDILLIRSTAMLIVLCGKNDRLRQSLSYHENVVPLGWRADIRDILAISDVMVHHAGGMAVWEAVIANVPMITYHPLPGHGKLNASALDQSGVSVWVQDRQELRAAIESAICKPRPQPLPAESLSTVNVVHRISELIATSGNKT